MNRAALLRDAGRCVNLHDLGRTIDQLTSICGLRMKEQTGLRTLTDAIAVRGLHGMAVVLYKIHISYPVPTPRQLVLSLRWMGYYCQIEQGDRCSAKVVSGRQAFLRDAIMVSYSRREISDQL